MKKTILILILFIFCISLTKIVVSENCTSHSHSMCYDNDLYWYNSCNQLEDKKEECDLGYFNHNNLCSVGFCPYCEDNNLYTDIFSGYSVPGCDLIPGHPGPYNCRFYMKSKTECNHGCYENAHADGSAHCKPNGNADFAWFIPKTGKWKIFTSSTGYSETKPNPIWGGIGDKPIPADYDGDGKIDPAVHRSDGYLIATSSINGQTVYVNTNIPPSKGVAVPADYDGDEKTDFALFVPSTGKWKIFTSSTNYQEMLPNPIWGGLKDKPVPADYDGDKKADLAVFRSDGVIAAFLSSNQQNLISPKVSPLLKPVIADYDGDGKADFAWFISITGKWKIFTSSTNYQEILPNPMFGDANSIPVPSDYDGDGKADIAVHRSDGLIVASTTNGLVYIDVKIPPSIGIAVPGNYDLK